MTREDTWKRAWAELGAESPDGLLTRLVQSYGEPHRAYHTMQHVEECLGVFDSVREEAQHPGEMVLALWFHDAIYKPRSSDNEQLSAQWALAELEPQVAPECAERVERLILATLHDVELHAEDERLMVDVDLNIFGADERRFDEYEDQVRQEFRWVPRPIYRKKRRQILEGFLERPRIFGTPTLYARFETQARVNLTRSIARLR